MNVFRINSWVIFVFFTLPALFFSENPYVISVLFFCFFLLYFFLLNTIEAANEDRGTLLRNRLECFALLGIYIIYPVAIIMSKQVYLDDTTRTIFSLIYFGIFIDLSLGFTRLFLKGANRPINFGRRVIIFLCMLVPPLGVFYLRYLYNRFYLLGQG
jgi:hypothetical protein